MTDEAVARDAIRATLAAYNIAGDRMKIDELAAQFTEDANMVWPGNSAKGRAEIAEKLGGRRAPPADAPAATQVRRPSLVRHNLTTSQILVDGDSATGRTYFMVVSDTGLDHMGVYVDRFRKVGGRWLISDREVRVDWQAETSLFAPMVTRGK